MSCAVACSTSKPSASGRDASVDGEAPGFDAGVDASPADDATMSLPPSPDCRFIDDRTTCVDTYILPGTSLYACGDITETDAFDGGIDRPYPPPLPATYDCRNVSPPTTDAGAAGQVGALWCCNGSPPACARSLALDVTCSGGSVAYSCPQMGSFPSGSDDGGSCTVAGVADAGVTLTPPLTSNEVIVCCPAR